MRYVARNVLHSRISAALIPRERQPNMVGSFNQPIFNVLSAFLIHFVSKSHLKHIIFLFYA